MADNCSLRKRKRHSNKDEIKVMIAGTDKIITLNVKGSDTVGSMKLKIAAKECIPFGQQELVFMNRVLHNNSLIENLCIKKHSHLTLMHKLEHYMEISVNSFTGKTISLLVYPTHTIANVKKQLRHKECIKVEEQVLIYNEIALGNTGTLVDFGINKKSTLTLMRKSTGDKQILDVESTLTNEFNESMQINIKIPIRNQTLTLEVKPSDSIHDIKVKIQDEIQIPCDEQELIFNEMVLDNMAILAGCNIKTESMLTMMTISTGIMHIFFKNLKGETTTLNVKRLETIHCVISKIHDMEGIPRDQLKLIWRGKPLNHHNATLADYKIPKESTLEQQNL